MKVIERLENMEEQERLQEIIKLWKKSDGKPYTFYQLLTINETTADEDFAEIGWKWSEKDSGERYKVYRDKYDREITIQNGEPTTYDNTENEYYTDTEIDQIRTIADKKRKEVWGNIHDKEVE